MKNFELCYFQEILFIGEPGSLLMRKAEMIFDKLVRYPEYLKIFDPFGFPWIFDITFDNKRVSNFIANGIFYGDAFVIDDFYENFALSKRKK